MSAKQSEAAVEKFLSGYNCAQSVLFAYAPELGVDSDMALKMTTGLGGGMARRGETCGAVTGGILVLGLKFGRGADDDRSVAEAAHRKTVEMMGAFAKTFGSCDCRDLLHGCDLRTPEGQRRFKEEDLHNKVCVPCVRMISEWLAGASQNAAAQSAIAPK